mgnify:CR=1 FL=1
MPPLWPARMDARRQPMRRRRLEAGVRRRGHRADCCGGLRGRQQGAHDAPPRTAMMVRCNWAVPGGPSIRGHWCVALADCAAVWDVCGGALGRPGGWR